MEIVLKYLNKDPDVTIQEFNRELDRIQSDDTLYDISEECFTKIQVVFDFLERQIRPNPSVLKLLLIFVF